MNGKKIIVHLTGICEERNRYCNEAESNYYMELDKDFCSVLKIQSYINDYEKKNVSMMEIFAKRNI